MLSTGFRVETEYRRQDLGHPNTDEIFLIAAIFSTEQRRGADTHADYRHTNSSRRSLQHIHTPAYT